MRPRVAILLLASLIVVQQARAAELKRETVAAFDRYVAVAEAAMDRTATDPDPFLSLDAFRPLKPAEALARLQKGDLLIDRVKVLDRGREIAIPEGMVHHWIGVTFIPGVRLEQAVALLQDYDRHADVYKPAVVRSRLLDRRGDQFRVYLRFFMEKVIAVTVNSEHEAQFVRVAPERVYSRIHSTRIAEVEHAGTPREREKPVGRDGGYLWRLNTYWRFLERDGGTYLQCESITLTRDLPFGFGWLVGPFVTSIPKESLTFTLRTTARTLKPRTAAATSAAPRRSS
jgi:hypothetical protein